MRRKSTRPMPVRRWSGNDLFVGNRCMARIYCTCDQGFVFTACVGRQRFDGLSRRDAIRLCEDMTRDQAGDRAA